MSHHEPETESIIFLTGGSCGWKCTDLSLISDTVTVECSAQEDKVQEKTEVCPKCVSVLWLQMTNG